MNIYDIAEKSGVSIATISRVLNGGKNVSPKTYQRVMAIIEEEGYTPNIFARGLGLNTMQTIGILVTDVADPYYARMISYLSQYLHALGLNVLLSCTGTDLKKKQRELKLLMNKRVDAIFLAGSAQQELDDNTHLITAAKSLPLIMVNGCVRAPGIFNVSANDAQAIRMCVHKLYEAGYKKPLYLYNRETYSGKQKINGYKKAVKELKLPSSSIFLTSNSNSLSAMQEAFLHFIDSKVEFDSIVAAEDFLAIAAIKALSLKKIRVPVIGYNNSVLAEASTPTLTSVDNMLEPLCQLAVQQFHDFSLGREIPTHVTLECKLIERESFSIKKNK